MTEYISREEAIKELREVYENEYPTASGDFDEYASHDVPNVLRNIPAADVQSIDDDNGHMIYIGRKAYLAENTIMEFMKKMDIIRDSLAYIENYFDTYAETIRQINACGGRCTDINEVKYFIDRIKENSGYD
jgi:hypothetical protein